MVIISMKVCRPWVNHVLPGEDLLELLTASLTLVCRILGGLWFPGPGMSQNISHKRALVFPAAEEGGFLVQ